jgi:pimeloyl-ACP methyl ester carboxylesterase
MRVRALYLLALGFAEGFLSSTSSGNNSWHYGGDFSVAVTGGTMKYYVITPSLSGVHSRLELYTDDLLSIETDKPVVILAHGFMRSRDDMTGHAKEFATAGFQVLVPQLLHSRISLFNPDAVDHELNGKNLVELAHQAIPNRSQRKVIYAGQSAGGLAAIVAASTSALESHGGGSGVIGNPNVVGLLGLDAVDTDDGIGTKAIVHVPDETTTALLYGRSSACNSRNNILPVFEWLKRKRAASPSEGVRIEHFPGADHCDFENPTSMMMTVMCRSSPFDWRRDHSATTLEITDRAKDALLWMASQ